MRATLSARERQVITRRMNGAPVKAVSADLGLADSSVAELQRRALEKLGVATVDEAIALSATFLKVFLHTPDGAPLTIAPRLTREDLRDLRNAYAEISRGLSKAMAVLDRIEEARGDGVS